MSNWQELYPFQTREMSLDGQRYHYVDDGDGDTLLFVHGNPTWSFYWHPLIAAFRGSHRCVAPDHIGCGMSDKPARYPYTLAQHIENLSQFVEQLDLTNITLLVHDWGGAIGLGAALRMPERFSRFVLFNTGAFPPPFIPLRIRVCRTPLLGRLAVQGCNAFARAALSMATEKPQRMTPAVRAGLLAPYDTWAHRTAVYNFVKDIPTGPRQPTWGVLEDIEEKLPTITDKPVQLIWGMRDWCFRPSCLTRLEELLPHTQTLRLVDAGHYVVLDAYERIVPALEDFFAHKYDGLPTP